MWSYYGCKWKIIKKYPKPTTNKIIEPFAGAGSYSLEHFENEIILVDKSPLIISVWQYLQSCSLNDIKGLPILPQGHVLKRDEFDCDGQYNLMRFIIAQASYGGNNVVSKWGALRFKNNIKKLTQNHHKIKHWKFICGDYFDLPNDEATWFIDPPYFKGGHKYPFSNKKIDFKELGEWCLSRTGQLIVCENSAANWLPFVPLAKTNGVYRQTQEVIYTNYHTHYNNIQQSLF